MSTYLSVALIRFCKLCVSGSRTVPISQYTLNFLFKELMNSFKSTRSPAL